jgi:hypothetical protein
MLTICMGIEAQLNGLRLNWQKASRIWYDRPAEKSYKPGCYDEKREFN